MITLYQFPRIGNMPNFSPFCMKLESYLKAMNINYKVSETFDPRKSPTGKVPYIEKDGQLQADSKVIIEQFESFAEKPMQAKLTAQEKAISHSFIRLMDEHLYWAILYSRWIDQKGAHIWAEGLQNKMGMPKIAFKLILSGIKKNIEKSIYSQGIGRHDEHTIYKLAEEDIKALASFLGGHDYCFGDEPTVMDHTLYAYVGSMIEVNWDYPLKDLTLQCQNLVDHYHRMMKEFFPEYESNDKKEYIINTQTEVISDKE